MAKKKTIDPAVAKAARIAGEVAGRSVALAEDAARRGLATAQSSSKTAAREFLKGFRKGLGKKRI